MNFFIPNKIYNNEISKLKFKNYKRTLVFIKCSLKIWAKNLHLYLKVNLVNFKSQKNIQKIDFLLVDIVARTLCERIPLIKGLLHETIDIVSEIQRFFRISSYFLNFYFFTSGSKYIPIITEISFFIEKKSFFSFSWR